MNKFRSFFTQYLYQTVLVLIAIVIFLTNYKEGTYLLGWDNFNSEFNPWLAVTQALSAGWSNFRSFGLVAGMGYATDLFHALFVWFAHFLLPITMIRYTFHIAMLAIGGLGVFSLFTYVGLSRRASFVGSLYYMLNFGTTQLFGLPYEPFSIFFSMLPWALLTWFESISRWDKKSLFRFLVANLLLSGAFYVQTMFVVYILLLSGINIIQGLIYRAKWRNIVVRSLCLWSAIFALNAYWLFTQLYFLFSSVSVVQDAKQTLLGLRVPFFQNKAHGGLLDFFTQTGYYADFEGKNGLAFASWLTYIQSWPIQILKMIVSSIIILGILERKNTFKLYAFWILTMVSIALLLDIPLIREINTWIRQSSFIDQIFRSPFSKFVVAQSLVFAFFFSLGLSHIQEVFHDTRIRIFLFVSGCVAIFILAFPAFHGHFFTPTVTVSVPNEYQTVFNFFDSQDPQKRIGLLPEMNIWGWYEYTWGYMGSGFLWHGMKQPIISRSYDVWSKTSENYFWEVTNALNKEDTIALEAVLKKYAISYLIFDQNLVVHPKASYKRDKIKEMIDSIPDIKNVLSLSHIDVYELRQPFSLFAGASSISNIGPQTIVRDADQGYRTHGVYETRPDNVFDTYYPFSDLQTQSYNPTQTWSIKEQGDFFVLSTQIPRGIRETPESTSSATQQRIILTDNNGTKEFNMNISISKHDTLLSVTFPKIALAPSNTSSITDCTSGLQSLPNKAISFESNADGYTIETAEGATACWGYHFDLAPQTYGYLIQLQSTTMSGLPATMSVIDHTNQQLLAQKQLNEKTGAYMILPSGPNDGVGFSVNFQNFSFPRTRSKSIISHPKVYIFPESFLKKISYGISQFPPTLISSFNVEKNIGSWYYSIKIPKNSDTSRLIFFQAFDPGWHAYDLTETCIVKNIQCQMAKLLPFLFSTELKNHILINNWANGWILPEAGMTNKQINKYTNNQMNGESRNNPAKQDLAPQDDATIILFFWPQILQWLGFLLLPIPFLFVVIRKRT